MRTFIIRELDNGHLLVEVTKDMVIMVERAYAPDDLKSIVSLLLLTFPPHAHSR